MRDTTEGEPVRKLQNREDVVFENAGNRIHHSRENRKGLGRHFETCIGVLKNRRRSATLCRRSLLFNFSKTLELISIARDVLLLKNKVRLERQRFMHRIVVAGAGRGDGGGRLTWAGRPGCARARRGRSCGPPCSSLLSPPTHRSSSTSSFMAKGCEGGGAVMAVGGGGASTVFDGCFAVGAAAGACTCWSSLPSL